MVDVILKNVVKKFGKVIAVDNVSFKAYSGKITVLLGPSGSGKSTILRLIAGLEFPDSGEIWIGDKLVNNLPPKDRDVAMVFQNYALYPHKTVYENLAFPLKVRRYPKEEIDRRVKEIARLLGIEELLNRKPRQLSGGQQQRVALGRALIRQPKVWLLDEPLSNLDAKLRVYMRAELKKLQRSQGITTIYVTHDQVEAMSLADRIVVLNKGKIQQVGTPHELYHKPANLFVATFIGSPPMNILKGYVKVHNERMYIDFGVGEIPVSDDFSELLKEYIGKDILVGIRPENIHISFEKVENSLKARVDVIEPLGNSSVVTLAIDKDTTIKVVYPEHLPEEKVGKEVYITFDQKRMHVFNPKNGQAII